MKGRVEILCGASGAGKTSRLLAIFREEIRRLQADGTPGQAVWITPTARSRRAVRRDLLDGSLGVCFAPNVFTFDAFAERLLQTTGPGITPLSRVAQRMIARTIIDEAVAGQSLEYFEPIANTSGFLDLVLGLIAELKRDETEPDDFAIACRKRNSPRDLELLWLYQRYQERLTQLALYDAEGRFWAARLELEGGRRGAFDPLALVIADGFADFTQPQYEILEHLAGYAKRVLVSLPLEQPVERADLFAKSHKALEEIRRRCTIDVRSFGASDSVNGAAPTRAEDRPVALRHVAEHLFANPRTLPQLSDATGIEVIAAAGPAGEARAVAERVKRLLLDGVPAEDIVIGTRSLDEEGADLRVALTGAGIRTCCETATRFSQTAIGRALFAVLQAELQDWAFNSLCSVLRSNYFRPRWQFANIEAAVETTIRVLRRYQLGSDRQHILKRLAKLLEKSESHRAESKAAELSRTDQVRQDEIRISLRLLQAQSDATKRLRTSKDLTGWTDSLIGLAAELGVEPLRKSERSSLPTQTASALEDRDRRVWDALCEVLREAAQVRELLNDRLTMSLADFRHLLRDLFESQTIVESPGEQDRVRVVEASDIRNLDIPYLFLTGLSEASFPRGRRDDCFYSAAERRDYLRKDRSGLEPSTPQQDEMLLFYSIVTRARRCLTLSYPSVSSSGQPLFPSPYVTAIRDLFYRPAIVPAGQTDLDPVPSRDRVLSTADLRLAATDELHFGRPGLFRTLATNPANEAAARGILATAEMDAFRFEQNGFTPFEGLLQHAPTIARLAEKYSSDHQFSATQLERYATCPFRFLLSDVLKLEPNDSIEPEIDPRKRGLSLHRVLANLHRAPSDQQPAAQPDPRELIEALRELVAGEFAVAADVPAYERALQAAELQFAQRFVDLYSTQCEDYLTAVGEGWEERPAPRFVELAFGDFKDHGEPAQRTPTTAPCVTFGTPEAPVRVRGRIDRVDVGRRGGKQAFTVIDYKTRWTPRYALADIELGLALQLAIYTSAARRSGLLDPEASVFQMAYWTLTLGGCVVGLKGKSKSLEMLDPALVGDIERTLHDVLPKITDRLRAGQFPVINSNLECGKWCPYSMVCRVGQVRSLEVERQKLWSLS
ncbi:MAG TPA: PD-(D/E)XK nuclease family protein [Planctomycetaceae bacterium]|jgi:ATP-dependent helicase/nuclease subunit B|nr:PD-(D/E)XK nuclease family protein [Planctomycetaceae bacterium]